MNFCICCIAIILLIILIILLAIRIYRNVNKNKPNKFEFRRYTKLKGGANDLKPYIELAFDALYITCPYKDVMIDIAKDLYNTNPNPLEYNKDIFVKAAETDKETDVIDYSAFSLKNCIRDYNEASMIKYNNNTSYDFDSNFDEYYELSNKYEVNKKDAIIQKINTNKIKKDIDNNIDNKKCELAFKDVSLVNHTHTTYKEDLDKLNNLYIEYDTKELEFMKLEPHYIIDNGRISNKYILDLYKNYETDIFINNDKIIALNNLYKAYTELNNYKDILLKQIDIDFNKYANDSINEFKKALFEDSDLTNLIKIYDDYDNDMSTIFDEFKVMNEVYNSITNNDLEIIPNIYDTQTYKNVLTNEAILKKDVEILLNKDILSDIIEELNTKLITIINNCINDILPDNESYTDDKKEISSILENIINSNYFDYNHILEFINHISNIISLDDIDSDIVKYFIKIIVNHIYQISDINQINEFVDDLYNVIYYKSYNASKDNITNNIKEAFDKIKIDDTTKNSINSIINSIIDISTLEATDKTTNKNEIKIILDKEILDDSDKSNIMKTFDNILLNIDEKILSKDNKDNIKNIIDEFIMLYTNEKIIISNIEIVNRNISSEPILIEIQYNILISLYNINNNLAIVNKDYIKKIDDYILKLSTSDDVNQTTYKNNIQIILDKDVLDDSDKSNIINIINEILSNIDEKILSKDNKDNIKNVIGIILDRIILITDLDNSIPSIIATINSCISYSSSVNNICKIVKELISIDNLLDNYQIYCYNEIENICLKDTLTENDKEYVIILTDNILSKIDKPILTDENISNIRDNISAAISSESFDESSKDIVRNIIKDIYSKLNLNDIYNNIENIFKNDVLNVDSKKELIKNICILFGYLSYDNYIEEPNNIISYVLENTDIEYKDYQDYAIYGIANMLNIVNVKKYKYEIIRDRMFTLKIVSDYLYNQCISKTISTEDKPIEKYIEICNNILIDYSINVDKNRLDELKKLKSFNEIFKENIIKYHEYLYRYSNISINDYKEILTICNGLCESLILLKLFNNDISFYVKLLDSNFKNKLVNKIKDLKYCIENYDINEGYDSFIYLFNLYISIYNEIKDPVDTTYGKYTHDYKLIIYNDTNYNNKYILNYITYENTVKEVNKLLHLENILNRCKNIIGDDKYKNYIKTIATLQYCYYADKYDYNNTNLKAYLLEELDIVDIDNINIIDIDYLLNIYIILTVIRITNTTSYINLVLYNKLYLESYFLIRTRKLQYNTSMNELLINKLQNINVFNNIDIENICKEYKKEISSNICYYLLDIELNNNCDFNGDKSPKAVIYYLLQKSINKDICSEDNINEILSNGIGYTSIKMPSLSNNMLLYYIIPNYIDMLTKQNIYDNNKFILDVSTIKYDDSAILTDDIQCINQIANCIVAKDKTLKISTIETVYGKFIINSFIDDNEIEETIDLSKLDKLKQEKQLEKAVRLLLAYIFYNSSYTELSDKYNKLKININNIKYEYDDTVDINNDIKLTTKLEIDKLDDFINNLTKEISTILNSNDKVKDILLCLYKQYISINDYVRLMSLRYKVIVPISDVYKVTFSLPLDYKLPTSISLRGTKVIYSKTDLKSDVNNYINKLNYRTNKVNINRKYKYDINNIIKNLLLIDIYDTKFIDDELYKLILLNDVDNIYKIIYDDVKNTVINTFKNNVPKEVIAHVYNYFTNTFLNFTPLISLSDIDSYDLNNKHFITIDKCDFEDGTKLYPNVKAYNIYNMFNKVSSYVFNDEISSYPAVNTYYIDSSIIVNADNCTNMNGIEIPVNIKDEPYEYITSSDMTTLNIEPLSSKAYRTKFEDDDIINMLLLNIEFTKSNELDTILNITSKNDTELENNITKLSKYFNINNNKLDKILYYCDKSKDIDTDKSNNNIIDIIQNIILDNSYKDSIIYKLEDIDTNYTTDATKYTKFDSVFKSLATNITTIKNTRDGLVKTVVDDSDLKIYKDELDSYYKNNALDFSITRYFNKRHIKSLKTTLIFNINSHKYNITNINNIDSTGILKATSSNIPVKYIKTIYSKLKDVNKDELDKKLTSTISTMTDIIITKIDRNKAKGSTTGLIKLNKFRNDLSDKIKKYNKEIKSDSNILTFYELFEDLLDIDSKIEDIKAELNSLNKGFIKDTDDDDIELYLLAEEYDKQMLRLKKQSMKSIKK